MLPFVCLLGILTNKTKRYAGENNENFMGRE